MAVVVVVGMTVVVAMVAATTDYDDPTWFPMMPSIATKFQYINSL
jgi:hypothetical protein